MASCSQRLSPHAYTVASTKLKGALKKGLHDAGPELRAVAIGGGGGAGCSGASGQGRARDTPERAADVCERVPAEKRKLVEIWLK